MNFILHSVPTRDLPASFVGELIKTRPLSIEPTFNNFLHYLGKDGRRPSDTFAYILNLIFDLSQVMLSILVQYLEGPGSEYH
jgi:hypothetical protein